MQRSVELPLGRQSFRDVSSDDWAYPHIPWGLRRGLTSMAHMCVCVL